MNNDATSKSILLLAANPKGTGSLRLQQEERDIKERLRLAGYGKVPINSTVATRIRDIHQAMLDFKPQIVHFTGHGTGEDGLVFEDVKGHLKLIDADALANLFKLFSEHVECVILNACYSKPQAEMISRHIDYVIGTSQEISDGAAIAFAVGFYTALGAGKSIAFAYKLGCNAIQLEGLSEHLTPVLFLKKQKHSNNRVDIGLKNLDGSIFLSEQETNNKDRAKKVKTQIGVENHLAVGIHLGIHTSKICIYTCGSSKPVLDPATKLPAIPSIVAIDSKGDLLIGDIASGYVDVHGRGIREIRRLMGTSKKIKLRDKEFCPEEISALILRKLKENAEFTLEKPINDVVISVPTSFCDTSRQATLNAAELAGFNVLHLISEPIAIALACGIKNIDEAEKLIVFDWGSNNLDITVLAMFSGVLDAEYCFGEPDLGSKDFDESLFQLIRGKFQSSYPDLSIPEKSYRKLKEAAETAKKILTNQKSHLVSIPAFAIQSGDLVDLEVEVSREEFDNLIFPLLERARNCIIHGLSRLKIRLITIDRVLLFGDATHIPAVSRLIAEIFGRETVIVRSPDFAVGVGASISAAIAQTSINAAK